MIRWFKMPEEQRPEVISDIYDDKLYTFIVQNLNFEKIKRKTINSYDTTYIPTAAHARLFLPVLKSSNYFIDQTPISKCWEGWYLHPTMTFKTIIDNNVPCALMHKVKNEFSPELDTIVVFMTGDIFWVHPGDLKIWDPNDV